jgi:ankyrin repeat protein
MSTYGNIRCGKDPSLSKAHDDFDVHELTQGVNTALLRAAKWNNVEMASLLITAGADMEIKNKVSTSGIESTICLFFLILP